MRTRLFQGVTAPRREVSRKMAGAMPRVLLVTIIVLLSADSGYAMGATNQRRAPNAIFLPNFQKGHEFETELVPANGTVLCVFKFDLLTLKGRNIILSTKK